ncbi:hypothetical protein ACHAW6_007582 [Cyclotella cf. meneghiniana]
MSNPLTESSLTGTHNDNATPFTLYAITSHPDTNPGGNHAANREAIQHLCPYTGSNLTARHSLRISIPTSTSFGIRCLLPLPAAPDAYVGNGASSRRDDQHVFLLSSASTEWKIRPPEPLSTSPQSMALSPNGGRHLLLCGASGNVSLHSWTETDNFLRVWRAHHRAATCVAFDGSGSTVFTGGEDGVVNAWCFADLVGGRRTVDPVGTWAEHALPVAWIRVCGGGGGSLRLISCSLDRCLVVMEMGGVATGGGARSDFDGGRVEARVLARMCLPSGLHCVISDSLESRLYAAAEDGNIYCVDMDAYAIHETLDGGGTVVHVDRTKDFGGVHLESILTGNHVVSQKQSLGTTLTDQRKYLSELKGHVKAVLSLALLDPSDLTSTLVGSETPTLLASGSEDGTVRIWDLRSRSCVRVLRPWASSSEGISLHLVGKSPPVTGLIAVPKATAVSSDRTLFGLHSGRRSRHSLDVASIFKPLKRFVRGSSEDQDKTGTESSTPSEDFCLAIRPRRHDASFWQESIHDSCFSRQSKKAKT